MKTGILLVFFIFLSAHLSLALTVNDPAPPITLRDNNGGFFYLSNYTGLGRKESVKGVIINFFSSTCKPCKNELPVLNSLVDEFSKKGVKIVIIGFREDFEAFRTMLTSLGIDKPVILSDRYGKAGEKYGVKGVPMTFLIGADGLVKDVIPGELQDTEKTLRERAGKFFK